MRRNGSSWSGWKKSAFSSWLDGCAASPHGLLSRNRGDIIGTAEAMPCYRTCRFVGVLSRVSESRSFDFAQDRLWGTRQVEKNGLCNRLGPVEILVNVADIPIHIVLQRRHGAEVRVARRQGPLKVLLIPIGLH